MKYKINQILKVKKGCLSRCHEFKSTLEARYVKIISLINWRYSILDENKESIGSCNCFTDEHLEPITKDWDTLEVGDVLLNWQGEAVRVLGVCGEVVHISHSSDNSSFYKSFTLSEIKGYRFTIKQEEEPQVTELTLEEIAKKFNMPVEQLRIKE